MKNRLNDCPVCASSYQIRIDVELAKITTLGERVEDSFLLQGAQLQHARTQLAIEQELLDVLEPA